MLIEIRDRASSLKVKGYSLAAAISAKPTEKYDAKLSGGFVSPDLFTSLVYQGV